MHALISLLELLVISKLVIFILGSNKHRDKHIRPPRAAITRNFGPDEQHHSKLKSKLTDKDIGDSLGHECQCRCMLSQLVFFIVTLVNYIASNCSSTNIDIHDVKKLREQLFYIPQSTVCRVNVYFH
jgi:hypothetical protein